MNSDDNSQTVQASRAMQAVHSATWFALCEGDRYTALGRKAVANSFYNLLPMLAEIREAIAERDGVARVATAAGDPDPPALPPRLRLVAESGPPDEPAPRD